MESAMTARPVPFEVNQYAGDGSWEDRAGQRGRFTTEFKIIDETSNALVQITRRCFLKEDGSLLYEENSEVRFTRLEGHFVEVTIRAAGKEHVGQGHVWGNHCHYELEVDDGVQVENTYTFVDGRVELIGSSTNKGNFTIWGEVLVEGQSQG
jgi:hypothetical protein